MVIWIWVKDARKFVCLSLTQSKIEVF